MSATYVFDRVKELAPAFLQGLNPSELAEVLKAGSLRRLRPRSVIASEGDRADKVALLLEGRARHFTTTSEGDKISLELILPGEITGGIALVKKPTNYLVSTDMLVDSALVVWKRGPILTLARRYPVLLENMLLIGAEYLIEYRERHIAARLNNASMRLAWVLDQLATEMGHRVNGATELIVSNEELANQASVTVLTVGKLLDEWRKKGLLAKDRGRIRVNSMEQLIRMAG